MTWAWTRRDVLRTIVTAAAAPVVASADAGQRRRVGIIGAGMAGVSLAWLLDGARDVVVFERGDDVGGNVRSVPVAVDGHEYVVDIGAQFFHPGPYPLYTALLRGLGLFPPDVTTPGPSRAFNASITVTAEGEATPRFVSPIVPDRLWPLLPAWNHPGIAAFATLFAAARKREQRNESWALTMEEWLPTLNLSQAQWEGIILPWAASLFSGRIDQARGLSARAAMIFAAKAVSANPLEPVVYYILNHGLVEAIRRLLEQTLTVEVLTNASVGHVTRVGHRFRVNCADGRSADVDDLVFACSGPATRALVDGLPGTEAQRLALAGLEFHDARLALHTDAVYAPSPAAMRSFLNCGITGGTCEASMWMQPVITNAEGSAPDRLWKSWVTHRGVQPAEVLQDAWFSHMLPTPATIDAQSALRRQQGRGRLWFAGGYLHPYDAQETALRSALGVAIGLQLTTPRCRWLMGASQH